jgi:Zn-dependent protease with chaperone function
MGAAYVAGQPGFVVAAGIEKLLTTEQLFGVVCHEVGHLKYGDIYRGHEELSRDEIYEAEYRADRFAIQMGMAKGLRDALQTIYDRFPTINEDSDTHPALSKRIARLTAYLESRGAK